MEQSENLRIAAEISDNQKFELDTRNLKFFKEDIFHLPFSRLSESLHYKHLKHVFVDEDDYEDFKDDLVNFHHLQTRWKDDRKKVSRERKNSYIHTGEHWDVRGPSIQRLSSSKETGVGTTEVETGLCTSSGEQGGFGCLHAELDEEIVEYKGPSRLDSQPVHMMELFNDEDFQEFDRVFETVKNKRRYASNSSLDKYRWSPRQDGQKSDDSSSDTDTDDVDPFPEIKVDDIFSDFFNNDDDFKNFETEFNNFQLKRRSKALERWHRSSVCDLIEDLKAFCDSEDSSSSSNKTKLPGETKLGLPCLWSQDGEWDYIFNKLRQKGGNASSVASSDTYRSDVTAKCDSESGDYLLDDFSDSGSCRDTGYYSESSKLISDNQIGGILCTQCRTNGKHDCQYTCHHQCMPLIQLECKSVTQEQEDEGAVLSGETTLSDLNLSHQAASGEPLSEPATEKDETDSGYRSGTIPDEKLPPRPSDATLNRDQLKKRIAEFNKHVHGANFALKEEESGESKESFQGFIKVVLNLMRPISMSLGARPPSIYEVLTREHIIEQNTQHISFYMPRDTVRSIHAHSSQTTKEVVTLLLKKFHILDHPRKFALYEQELKNNKIACIRRVKDGEFPLAICLSWDLENINNHRLVLQENETGEVDWEAFCKPELNNFLRVLDREEKEYIAQLEYKYKVMRRLILQRMKELRLEAERERRGAATS